MKLRITPAQRWTALTVTAIACIAAGTWALWGWPVASLTIGAILWVDLFCASREIARAARTPEQ